MIPCGSKHSGVVRLTRERFFPYYLKTMSLTPRLVHCLIPHRPTDDAAMILINRLRAHCPQAQELLRDLDRRIRRSSAQKLAARDNDAGPAATGAAGGKHSPNNPFATPGDPGVISVRDATGKVISSTPPGADAQGGGDRSSPGGASSASGAGGGAPSISPELAFIMAAERRGRMRSPPPPELFEMPTLLVEAAGDEGDEEEDEDSGAEARVGAVGGAGDAARGVTSDDEYDML